MKFIKVKCDWCGKEFDKYYKKVGPRNFCCVDCVNKHRTKKLNPEGYQRNWNAEKLSNYNRKYNPSKMNAEIREKIRGKHLGKGEGKTYEKTYGRHTHRIIAEQKIGRPLKLGEVVHHIDGNIRNNDPDNLMVFRSQKEHVKWHAENDKKWGDSREI